MSTYRIRYEFVGTDSLDIDAPSEIAALELFDHLVRTHQIGRNSRVSVTAVDAKDGQ